MSKDVSIIGGGPAGMTAAIAAARGGARVRLWEKNHSLGRKLLVTGNGRCNFTNRTIGKLFYHSQGSQDLSDFIKIIDSQGTQHFFKEMGIEPWEDERGRFFPRSQEAPSVLLVMEREMERLGVDVRTRCDIVGIERSVNGFILKQRGEAHRSERVIIACGGCASPQFGSNGSGYELARQAGHRITKLGPALVPWEISGNWFHTLQGIRWDMELTLVRGDGQETQFIDEGLFTKYGLSGPLALRSSRMVGVGAKEARLNFMPDVPLDTLREKLEGRRKTVAQRRTAEFLAGLLPEKLGRLLVRGTGIAPDTDCDSIADDRLSALARNITAWPVRIKGLRPFKEAQVTAGGVDLSQVDPGTLESKLAPGLFFCGEVLDVDGDSGGYNLQWCWSSGWAAGTAAARLIK